MMENEEYDQSNENDDDMMASSKKMSSDYQQNKNLIGRSYAFTD